jgi:hypothetical protein
MASPPATTSSASTPLTIKSRWSIFRHGTISGLAIASFSTRGSTAKTLPYQEVRDKRALQSLLDAYLRKELAAWAKRFPDEFYEHIYRLRNWKWKGRNKNPPQAVAGYTKDIVYARLAPQIIDELERKNPIEGGRRRAKHHQWLTDDVGHPALAQHLHAVITLMRVSKSWAQFKMMLDQAHPKRGDTLQLPLMLEAFGEHAALDKGLQASFFDGAIAGKLIEQSSVATDD